MSNFRHKMTGEEVSIEKDNGNFYTLSNGKQILKNLFISEYVPSNMPDLDNINQLDKKINEGISKLDLSQNQSSPNTGQIDPENFFNNPSTSQHYSSLVDQLENPGKRPQQQNNNYPQSNETIISNDGVVMREPSKEELIREARQRNAEWLKKHGRDTSDIENGTSTGNVNGNPYGLSQEEEQKRQDEIMLTGKDPYANKNVVNNQPQRQSNPEDSVLESLMQGFNNNYKIDLKLKITEKIVEPTFIKMISNNVKGDIIDYYARMFLDKILFDPDELKELIYDQLYFDVYGKKPEKKKEPVKEEETEEEIVTEKEPVKEEKIEKKEPKETIVDEIEDIEEPVIEEQFERKGQEIDGVFYFSGKPTKTGKETYKFINEKGEVKDYLLSTGKKKGYRPAKNEDL